MNEYNNELNNEFCEELDSEDNSTIEISEAQRKLLEACLDKLRPQSTEAPDDKFGVYINSMVCISAFLLKDAEAFDDTVFDLDNAISEKSVDGIVNGLSVLTNRLAELSEDIEILRKQLESAACAFCEATGTPIPPACLCCTPEHIRSLLDKYFVSDRRVTVAFRGEDIAIIFTEKVDGKDVPVYYKVIGIGDEEEYNDTVFYVHRLIDPEYMGEDPESTDPEEDESPIEIPDDLKPGQYRPIQ